MSLAFEGKAALVTGASRGIGKAIAERLAADGAAGVIQYTRNEQLAPAQGNKIFGKGGQAVAIHADISKSAHVRRLFNEAEKAMARLDIVVANAGVHILKPFAENTEADYDYIFNTNTKRVFHVAGGGTPRARRWSHCRSFDGRHEDASPQQLALSRKQRGYRAICPLPGGRTRPRNVTVNILSPGFTDTDMMPEQYRAFGASLSPFNRVGTPEDVADVAAFLASDAARWVTGQNVQAGGGVV